MIIYLKHNTRVSYQYGTLGIEESQVSRTGSKVKNRVTLFVEQRGFGRHVPAVKNI